VFTERVAAGRRVDHDINKFAFPSVMLSSRLSQVSGTENPRINPLFFSSILCRWIVEGGVQNQRVMREWPRAVRWVNSAERPFRYGYVCCYESGEIESKYNPKF